MNVRHLLILVSFIIIAPLASAQKIVTLDMDAAMLLTEYAKKKNKELEESEEIVQVKAKYDGLIADLKAIDKDEKANALTWSQDQKVESNRKKAAIQQNLQLIQKQFQAASEDNLQKIGREVQPVLATVLKQLIDSKGIDLVLHRRAAIHTSEKMDITRDLVKAIDKEMKKSKKK